MPDGLCHCAQQAKASLQGVVTWACICRFLERIGGFNTIFWINWVIIGFTAVFGLGMGGYASIKVCPADSCLTHWCQSHAPLLKCNRMVLIQATALVLMQLRHCLNIQSHMDGVAGNRVEDLCLSYCSRVYCQQLMSVGAAVLSADSFANLRSQAYKALGIFAAHAQ